MRSRKFWVLPLFSILTVGGYAADFPNGNNTTPYERDDGGTDTNSSPSQNSSTIT